MTFVTVACYRLLTLQDDDSNSTELLTPDDSAEWQNLGEDLGEDKNDTPGKWRLPCDPKAL